MGKYVNSSDSERTAAMMFRNFSGTAAENFLKSELTRYLPQLTGKSQEEIERFINYQKSIYLRGRIPELGIPVASLNPGFIESADRIKLELPGREVYTRLSVKENGYRFQLHILPDAGAMAFSRQFTRYDLRLFPELEALYSVLPVMIGDAELINKRFEHLAGFNRLEYRIPGAKYWPRQGADKLDDQLVASYLANPELFDQGRPLAEFELILAFHGLFAIAHPQSWYLPKRLQAKQLISLCHLPIDYRLVDTLLDALADFLQHKRVNARIVERKIVTSRQELKKYIKEKNRAGLEGVCVSQTAADQRGLRTFEAGKSYKIKKYETIDTVLMGVYLMDGQLGLAEANLTGGLLGLFDNNFTIYLPAMKVNFDPDGPQVKTEEQKRHLMALRREILAQASARIAPNSDIINLYQAFLKEGEIMLGYFLSDGLPRDWQELAGAIPRGCDLASLLRKYLENPAACGQGIKNPKTAEKFILNHLEFFRALAGLDKSRQRQFMKYLSKTREIKETSSKLVLPQVVLDLKEPILVEAKVFNVKWNLCPYPAGFHGWYGNSFHFTNVFAHCLRYDKDTTTDYETVYNLARLYTVKKSKRRKKNKL